MIYLSSCPPLTYSYNTCVNRNPDRCVFVTFPALALLAVALVLALGPARTPYLDLLRRGDAHAARAERTAAVAAYREAARLRPVDPGPHLRLAQLYLDWGRADDAVAALAEARGLGAEELELERLRVAVHAARADWPDVVEHARRLLALAPTDRPTRHTLARAYLELQEWDAARAEYEALVDADPADGRAHERLGALLAGDDPAAIQQLFAAGTDLADRLLAALGKPGAAEDPTYASALLGQVLFEEREWALAARLLKRAVSDNPGYPDAHAYLGYALDRMSYVGEARSHLQRAVALAPDSAVAHTFLGLHYERLGDFAAARAEFETAYDLDPDNPGTCVEIGHTWAAEGRYVAAEIWLRQAVSLQPDDAELWKVLARFYIDRGITADGRGVEAAQALVELAPEDARAHDLRGWAAFQVGDYDTARDSLVRATLLDPALASAHYHLGRLWAAQGAYQDARDAYTRALDLDTTGALVPFVRRAMEEVP